MPNVKSAAKRLRTNEKSRVRNKIIRSEIRTRLKKVRSSQSKEEAAKELPRLFSLLDKAGGKKKAGFNKNKAANYKRKAQKVLNSLS